jgi:hypothetical protein
MIAGATALTRQTVPIVAGATGATTRVVELVVIIRAQITHPGHDDNDDKGDQRGENDQRGLHDTIQHGVALSDSCHSRGHRREPP